MTIDFARNTNHNYRNLDALKQLMQKKNKVENVEDSKVYREVRSYTCSICCEKGHNKKLVSKISLVRYTTVI